MEFSLIYRSKIIENAYKDWVSTSDTVLDIGCGNGVVTEELGRRFSCHIVGTDVLDYRKRKIPFKIMNGQNKLPFSDNEFNISMLNDVLHHCDNQEKLLNEAFRVADKVLIFEVEPSIITKILDIIINQIHNFRMNIPLNFKTSQEWMDYFKNLNFDFEYRKTERPLFYPFINFSFRLKNKII